ncbi:hypothetical protein PRK78_001015 [Emydomyces testavorans]|uniref:Uncharacterized protein n=1 Tax=Emydomyces testavorans TaxID=2070801 RepID=A0AAF0DBT4_9EURO|nr:hypothetical protein PRK78_001015 [Emydomyces testavorans]
MAKHKLPNRAPKGSKISISRVFRRHQQPRISKSKQGEPLVTSKARLRNAAQKRDKAAQKNLDESGSGLPMNQATLHEFSRSLENTRDEIVEEAFNSLFTAEQLLADRLSASNAASMRKLHKAELSYSGVLGPLQFSGPIPQSSSRRQQVPERTGYTDIDDQVGELHLKLKLIETTLEQHWQEWTSIQNKILCLGVEILGPDFLDSLGSNTYGSLKRKISQATGRYEKQAARNAELEKIVERQREDVTLLTRDTLKDLVSQEKKWRNDTRQQNEELCRLARIMITGV